MPTRIAIASNPRKMRCGHLGTKRSQTRQRILNAPRDLSQYGQSISYCLQCIAASPFILHPFGLVRNNGDRCTTQIPGRDWLSIPYRHPGLTAMNLACADERQYSIIPAEERDQFQITLRRKQYRFSFGRQVDNCSRCRIY